MPAPSSYRFGPFTLDPASFRLHRGSDEVPLTPKSFEILALLVRERHRGLTKQELFDAVWPETAVTENTLTQRVKEIREALGDSAQQPSYIRTIPRIGFQFIAAVTEVADASSEVRGDEKSPRAPAPDTTVTPAGVTPDESVPADARAPKRRGGTLAIVVVAVAVAAAGAVLYRSRAPENPGAPAAESSRRVMLAILPFENLSGDPEQGYFSDGLTEEMITELGRLDPAGLGVIARTSAMAYKSTKKSVAQVAQELGVEFILEGSVRRESERVRIVAQLIRASDQTHVWAQRYDRDLRSVLSLQTEVARAIAAETRTRLSPEALARLGRPLNVHPDAYQAYLKGRFFLNQRTGEAIQKALDHFQQAIAAEPAYAQAYAGLADAHELLASYANAVPRESFARGLEAAQRALELDPELSEPHASLGTIHASYTWDWGQSEKSYERALALNPSNALARKGHSELLSFLGRHDAAIAEAQHAVALDPLSLMAHANLGIIYYRARRYEDAVRQINQALTLDPNYMLAYLNLGLIRAAQGSFDEAAIAFDRARSLAPEFTDALGLLGYAYGKAGRKPEAVAIGSRLRQLSATRFISGYILAQYHLGLGEREQALTELERAYEHRSWLVALLKVDPLYDELRAEPRFQALLDRLKFPAS